MTEAKDSATEQFEFPRLHDQADRASLDGQEKYLRLSKVRLIALVVAAVAGACTAIDLDLDLIGLTILLAFFVAVVAEGFLFHEQPERDWYSGRAVAESVKTLSWRYAVKAEPFETDDDAEALAALQDRTRLVVEKGRDRLNLGSSWTLVTPSMEALRHASFETRRSTYLEKRTADQEEWYSKKADTNKDQATDWRRALIVGELAALVAAAVAFERGVEIDFAGIAAALVASGAAWVAIKQHSQLTSAYSVAASELALQRGTLEQISEEDWPRAAANAEEAISREHTMWLASRGEEPLRTN